MRIAMISAFLLAMMTSANAKDPKPWFRLDDPAWFLTTAELEVGTGIVLSLLNGDCTRHAKIALAGTVDKPGLLAVGLAGWIGRDTEKVSLKRKVQLYDEIAAAYASDTSRYTEDRWIAVCEAAKDRNGEFLEALNNLVDNEQ